MGQASSFLKDSACRDWARYVFNACHVHSKCCDCCELDIETTEVDIPSESEWMQISQFSKNWNMNVIQPLRNARKSITEKLENHPANLAYAELREQVKGNELAAEKIQQETIQSLLELTAKETQSFSTEEALANLSHYFSELNITQTTGIKKSLLTIAEKAALI